MVKLYSVNISSKKMLDVALDYLELMKFNMDRKFFIEEFESKNALEEVWIVIEDLSDYTYIVKCQKGENDIEELNIIDFIDRVSSKNAFIKTKVRTQSDWSKLKQGLSHKDFHWVSGASLNDLDEMVNLLCVNTEGSDGVFILIHRRQNVISIYNDDSMVEVISLEELLSTNKDSYGINIL